MILGQLRMGARQAKNAALMLITVMMTFINCKMMCRFQVFAKAVHGVDRSSLEPNFSIVASAHKECKVRLIFKTGFSILSVMISF